MADWFRDKEDEKRWFHHYAMLNTSTYRPLPGHWHLYYVELGKSMICAEKGQTGSELEQWSCFIGGIRDSGSPLEPFLKDNEGIREVYDMLQTFTEDDRLREQYRLHEEWLRVQRTGEARRERLQRELRQERKAKEAALRKVRESDRLQKQAEEAALQKVKESDRLQKELKQAEEAALQKVEESDRLQKKLKQAEEAALQKVEESDDRLQRELKKAEEMERRSVLLLKKSGTSDEEIAQSLEISLEKVRRILS